MMNCIATNLAQGLKLKKENIFITYSDAYSGRVYADGKVIKKTD